VLSLLKAGGYFIGITRDSSVIWYGIVIAAVICSLEKMFIDLVVFCIHRLLCTLCLLRANLPMLMLFMVYVEDVGAQLKFFNS